MTTDGLMNEIRLLPLLSPVDQQLQSPLEKLLEKPTILRPTDQQLQSPLGKLPAELIILIASKLPDNHSVNSLSMSCRKFERTLMDNKDIVRICSERLYVSGKLKFEKTRVKKGRVDEFEHKWKACEKFYTANLVPEEAPIPQLKELAARVKKSEEIISDENWNRWCCPVVLTVCCLTCGCGCLACVIFGVKTCYNRCVYGEWEIFHDDDPNDERDYLNPET